MTELAAGSRPHPKIRARRAEVQREAGRRRLRFLLVGAGLAATLPVGWGLTRSPVFDVDRVLVAGAQRTDGADILGAAALPDAMADVSEAAVARRIERLPWIADARVNRKWPGTVAISVTERSPVAVVEASASAWALADRHGRVLAPAGGPQPELPLVRSAGEVGPPGAHVHAETAEMLGLVGRLDREVATRVDLVRLAGDPEDHAATRADGVELVLDTGTVVRFGPLRDVGAKIVALRTLVKRADLRGAVTIDVRVPSAPVLTRR